MHYDENQADWWDPESGEHLSDEDREKARASSLIGTARNLETLQSEIHRNNLLYGALYSNRQLAAFDWGTGDLHRVSLEPINRTGENLVVSIVETLVNQVGKQRPKAKPVTRGASWKLRRKARLLDKFLWGEFLRSGLHGLGKRVYRDAQVFGFGALYFELVDEQVCIERVFPDEILVDQMEVVACGRPRHIYRRRVLPVDVVAHKWGVDAEDIADCAGQKYLEYRAVGAGWVVVVEAWQLAVSGLPGYYMAAVDGKVLAEKAWKSERPPFVFYHAGDPLDGFYAPSTVERILPYQIRLNEINEVIRDAQDIMGRPRLLVAEGSRVNPLEIDNLVARIIKYTGIKPEAVTWPAVSAELYNERDRLVSMCERQLGVTNSSVSGSMPSNVRYDSSAALREHNAIQDDRQADPSQRLEEFYLECAKQIIRTIDVAGAKPTTLYMTGGKYAKCERIDWSEIDIDEDAYVLQLEATSIVEMSPSAARDDLEKQFAMGVITPEQYRLERSHPDDQAELSLQAAAAADIRRVIELLEEGGWEDPTPVQDLVNGVQLVSLALLNLNQYEDDEDEDYKGPRLEQIKLNFLDWITAARGWLDDGADEHETGEPMDPASMGMDPSMMAQGVGPAAIPVPEASGMATGMVMPPTA